MEEDDSPQGCSHSGSPRLPVKGMESVVASVSGYHGSERFNLIKLIDRAGASYVGNMNPSITHLVCWKFEGRKYELAKKLRIPIVNHSWIEDCVKKGRRVPEEPYTYSSGEEIGPFVLDIVLNINLAKSQSKDLKNGKRPIVDTELDGISDAACKDPILLDEDLFPKQRQNSPHSSRSLGKAIKRNPRETCPSSSRGGLDTLSTTKIIELKETSTSQHANSFALEKRSSTSSDSRSKGHRLVKKHITLKDWLTTSNVDNECEEAELVNKCCRSLVDSSVVERHRSTSNRHTSNTRSTLTGLENSDACDTVQEIEQLNDDDIEEIEHLNHENHNSHARAAPSSEELEEVAGSAEEDNILPVSSELSCAICWTEFSPTRGVLPCGHRFCFECIQKWAEHMSEKRKPSTCPLCKACFLCITKVDDADSSDQKIYSQSMPNDSSKMDLYILPDDAYSRPTNASPPVCLRCSSREPVDLLISCDSCQVRCVHMYCLDPPLLPWTCVQCKELHMIYLQNR